mmetsp:Transcript_184783/g.586175  ORF Transcript_184783/g.586175 Transcript_184783/m.586175 type:complete len:407 (-) Transcript_184783:232-1452(-)
MKSCRFGRVWSQLSSTLQKDSRFQHDRSSSSTSQGNRIKHVVAIASCKGGVGKSSVTVNLAYMMQRMLGKKVGVLDVDVYGPSLPFQIPGDPARSVRATPDGKMISPILHEGVKLMSLGFLSPGDYAAVRGPIASGIVQRLLTEIHWGDLDYLLLDMPPGTGDIHLTVAQTVKVDAALVVSTPQKLSLVDVDKGIRMWEQVGIPTVGIVENMSLFTCPYCDRESSIFSGVEETTARSEGEAANSTQRLAQAFGIACFHRLPIDPLLSRPHTVFSLAAASTRSAWRVLLEVARDVERIVERELPAHEVPEVVHDREENRIRMTFPGDKTVVSMAALARTVRLGCRSASMWDEFTGEKKFREEDIREDVWPRKIQTAGKYAVRIDWSDDHQSLFPYPLLEKVISGAGE